MAQSAFDVFLTVDRNLTFQQNISQFDIAVIVLVAKRNQYAVLQPLVADVQTVLAAVAPGQVIRVGAYTEGHLT